MRTGDSNAGGSNAGGSGGEGAAGAADAVGAGDGGAVGRGADAVEVDEEALREVVADAVTAASTDPVRMVAYARALGPDPALAHLDDREVLVGVQVGAAEIAAAQCRWLQLLAELVVRGVWADHGARTPGQWLSVMLGIAPSTARAHVRVGLRLRECPKVAERFAAGSLSYSKVRAITRIATPDTEQLLLDWADAAPAHVLDRIIADARRARRLAAAEDPADPLVPDQATVRDDLGLSTRWRDDGSYELTVRVDGPTGLQLEQLLERLYDLDQNDDVHDGNDRSLDVHEGQPALPDLDGTHDSTDSHDEDGNGQVPDEVADAGRVPKRQRQADLLVGALAAAVADGPADTSGLDRHRLVLHATAADLLAAADSTDVDSTDSAPAQPTLPAPGSAPGSAPASAEAATEDPSMDRGGSASAEAEGPDDGVGPDSPAGVSPGADGLATRRWPRRPVTFVRSATGTVAAMSARQLWRLACSAQLDLAVDRADGHPADLGRTRREPSPRLRRLLAARDRSCRFPGCGARRYLHAHHVVHWAEGGPTDLDNLLLLCSWHHTFIHTNHWRLQPAGPGRWTFHPPATADAPTGRSAASVEATDPESLAPRTRWTYPLGGPPPADTPTVLAAARAHVHDVDPDQRPKLLAAPHHDGTGYDHDLTVGVLLRRLAHAA